MSLLHRIPPLVSALAFGYGVGMTAPETALAPVRAAVEEHRESGGTSGMSYPAPHRGSAAAVAPPTHRAQSARDGFAARTGGPESRELGRLREVGPADAARGESCEIERPLFSRPQRLASAGAEVNVTDPDDLDMAGTEALSRLQMPDLKLTITRRTLKYVNFFARTDKGRRMFETWLKRSGKFQDLIQHELREWRLPEDLIWVSMIESGFDARVKSPAGAMGLWQFMPATGAVYGLVQNKHVDQRKNPRLATTAAAHHLRDLYMRFGSWDLALAAYNMGYEQLLDRIDRYGTADFNELARQEALPRETASYVPKIAAAALIANNLERFGFDQVEIMRPLDVAEIAVPPRLSLKTLAKAAGVSVKTIRSLNPDLLGDKVPPGHGDFIVNIPPEGLSRAHAMLPVLLQTEPVAIDDAAVLDPVDLVGGREARLKSSRGEGSLLSLLPPYKKRRTLRDPIEGLVVADDDAQDDDVSGSVEPRRQVKRSGRKTLLYKVGPGDTLLGIARQFAMDVDDVAKDNRIDEDAKLRAGAILKLRVKPSVLSSLDDRVEVSERGDKSDDAGRGSDVQGAKPSHGEQARPKTEAKRAPRDKASAARTDRPRG
ncbi:MAG: transglycosylase SLT domain-containing protein [Polyangiaceae bacterium]|nr:transglycosylase SLT domain-containing protein [Polyangiaceae bacterium]